MRDKRKFCRPIISKYPKVGDIIIKLKCGEYAAINWSNYSKIKEFFKAESFVGEDDPTHPGNIILINTKTGKEAVFSPSDYNSIKDYFEIADIIGNKKNPFNQHEYIDLGLPSGTLWGTMNIGANSETGTGTFYKYGETVAYDGTDYNTSTYTNTETINLSLENDAANVNWGGDWHIPTKELWTELVNNTTQAIISDYDNTEVNVVKFTKINDSSTFIILPMTGSYTDGELHNSDVAYYWANTLRYGSADYALFSSSYTNPSWTTAYGHGMQVRAVCDSISSQGMANTGDIICYNNILDTNAIFSYNDWLELDDDWDAVGIYGIETIEEEDTVGGEYVILANGTTFIINANDYSKVSNHWEHVDTIPVPHDYVDLGLPSGTKWATMNIGASSITDYGNYYKYGLGASLYDSTLSNYNGNENPLAVAADTAAQVWGGSWHMPTMTQIEELTANTTYQLATNYNDSGINGGLFTAQNGAVLFLPAAGNWFNGNQDFVGDEGYYWSSSPSRSDSAYCLSFGDDYKYMNSGLRNGGYSIRPVMD